MKNYFKPPNPVSPYSDDLVADYLGRGFKVQCCLDGESGGLTHIIKSMMNPKARRVASRKFNERRVVA